jgi:choline dehydrogenase-like flavoprotein
MNHSAFDAIVIGSGITGGWAAKELTEKGLRVLMLERGREIVHGRDYTTEHTPPWKLPFGGQPDRESNARDYPVQSRVWAFDETSRHFFVKDPEQPYSNADPEKPFMWFRTDVLGGKSVVWGRQVYRFSAEDFEANKRDGHGIDWPIRYNDLAPWYSHVEKFIGVSGEPLGLPQLPDSEFQQPMTLNAVEQHAKTAISKAYPERHTTIGRVAVQTEARNGRGACHYCGPCYRGCSAGAYFSSHSSTLPAARATGRLEVVCDAVVEKLDYDAAAQRVSGVRVIDARTRERKTYRAPLVFLCASTIASTQILLNSTSAEFPKGLANHSGVLGHYLTDHNYMSGAFGIMPGFEQYQPYGNRPNFPIIPRFRNIDGQDEDADFLRGYYLAMASSRMDWRAMHKQIPGFGKQFKQAMRAPGPWTLALGGLGEQLPRYDNHMSLHTTKKDRYGIPQVNFAASYGDNTRNMRRDMAARSAEMLRAAGAIHIQEFTPDLPMGESVHEMGTARMGADPTQSVLNGWNQAHGIPNLFVTDGACMASASCVNPSLTYMAITARAANYAAKQYAAGAI